MKEGWEILSIADICVLPRGLAYSNGDEVEFSSNIVLCANNVDLLANQLDLPELKYISDHIQIPSSKILRPGSLLVCTASGSKSHLGKVAFVDKDYGYAFGGFMGQITPLPSILPRFLFHALTSEAYKDFISSLSDGANINNLKSDDLARFQIPVPPLPEQQRIVALLDEAFAGIATTKANAERNLRNARSIFANHLEAVFSQRGDGWAERKLHDVCSLINGRAYKKDEILVSKKYPLLRVGNLFSNRDWYYSALELDDDKYCDQGDPLYAWSASFGPRIWEAARLYITITSGR